MSELRKGNGPARRYFGVVRMTLGAVATVALADGRTCGLPAVDGHHPFAPGTKVEVSLFQGGDGALRAFDPLATE